MPRERAANVQTAMTDAPPLREGEILPKKLRRAVTQADVCHWCGDPFAEPKRKRFVILDCNPDLSGTWGPHSICFECFKHGDTDSSSGLNLERVERKCNGCGEPMSIPSGDYGGTFRWFKWGVCSMRCYQRNYRKRRRSTGSSVDWKGRSGLRCEACKKPFNGKRADSRFCSSRCKQWMYRRRHQSDG
jgi:hypothetical protein